MIEEYAALNAHEPFRLASSFIRQRLRNTAIRAGSNQPHHDGVDYASSEQLRGDLAVVLAAARALDGPLVAEVVRRTARVSAAVGLTLATMDLREHAQRLHDALAVLLDGTEELDQPYSSLDRTDRTSTLIAELDRPRPLRGRATPPPLTFSVGPERC